MNLWFINRGLLSSISSKQNQNKKYKKDNLLDKLVDKVKNSSKRSFSEMNSPDVLINQL